MNNVNWKCEYCGSRNWNNQCCFYCGACNPLEKYITKITKPDVFMNLIDSSVLDSVGYDEFSERLVLCFKSNIIYEYQNVPKEVYLRFMGSDSKGRFYIRNIKGKYENRKS